MYNIINKKKLSCSIAIIFAVFLLNYAMPATVQVLAVVREATEQQYVTAT